MLKKIFSKPTSENIPMEKSLTQKDMPNERPMICLIDFDADVSATLRQRNFNITDGSLGNIVDLPSEGENFCILDYDVPENIHEYDILVIDMKDRKAIPYRTLAWGSGVSTTATAFLCTFPQTKFDPRPLSGGRFVKNCVKSPVGW